jgi:hypothetical protein
VSDRGVCARLPTTNQRIWLRSPRAGAPVRARARARGHKGSGLRVGKSGCWLLKSS